MCRLTYNLIRLKQRIRIDFSLVHSELHLGQLFQGEIASELQFGYSPAGLQFSLHDCGHNVSVKTRRFEMLDPIANKYEQDMIGAPYNYNTTG